MALGVKTFGGRAQVCHDAERDYRSVNHRRIKERPSFALAVIRQVAFFAYRIGGGMGIAMCLAR
jgi:hypothetical protein